MQPKQTTNGDDGDRIRWIVLAQCRRPCFIGIVVHGDDAGVIPERDNVLVIIVASLLNFLDGRIHSIIDKGGHTTMIRWSCVQFVDQ